MNRKLLTGVAIAAVAVLLAVWAASPVLAGQALIRAAKAGDERALEGLVDFPSLRDSLKAEINEELVSHFRRDPRVVDSGLGGLGMILAPMLTSGAVDAVVTPQGVAAMVREGQAPDPTDRTPPPATDADDGHDIHQSWGYRGLDTFAITLTRRDDPDRHLALVLDRRGLFSWKLAAVDIQNDARA
jgi:hypothetical protein